MAMHLKFVCRFGSSNVGDDNCSPIQYFPFEGFNVEKITLTEQREAFRNGALMKNSEDRYVIGGGFFDLKHFKCFAHSRQSVFWGGGIRDIHKNVNWLTRRQKKLPFSENIRYGVRDYGFGHDWVPCVSCMSPLFDASYEVKRDYGVFQHHRKEIKLPFDKRVNDNVSFADAVRFLAESECVITNSYHGAYWSILLGKRVFLFNEINQKTRTFKWMPMLCEGDEWRDKKRAPFYPEALEEARGRNEMFYQEVLDVLG